MNDGQVWHEALITRLPDGATVETYLAGARAGDAFPVSAVDVDGPGQIAASMCDSRSRPRRAGRASAFRAMRA